MYVCIYVYMFMNIDEYVRSLGRKLSVAEPSARRVGEKL